MCVPAVSYPVALCSMAAHTPGFDAFMLIARGCYTGSLIEGSMYDQRGKKGRQIPAAKSHA